MAEPSPEADPLPQDQQASAPQPADTPGPKYANNQAPGPVKRLFNYLGFQARRAFWAVRGLFGGGPPKRRARVYWDDDITLTLQNLVRETETKASGKVQVISLAAFRESIGELWERYQSRILMIAETSIARRIGRGNTFIALEDDSWLLLFSRTDEPQAQARADAIAAAIGQKLMGARFAFEDMPLPESARLGLADVLNAVGTVNLDAVRAEVGKIKADQCYRAPIPKSAARKAKDGKTHDGKPGGKRIVVRSRPLPAPPAVAPPPPVLEEPSQISRLTLRFRPAWTADSQSVNCFYFRAHTPEGVNITDDDTAALNNATALDFVRAGLKAFTDMRAAELPFTFVLPLPVSAFSITGLVEAQKLIAAVPREDRLRHLRLDLRRLPRANPERLIALRELFRSYVQGISFPINPFTSMDATLAIDHISYTADVARESACTDNEMFEALLMLKNRAGTRHVAVTGLRKRSHLGRAVGAGVAEVSGAALMDEVGELPHRLQTLPRESLIAVM